jgi:hypothetical protein
MERPIMITEDFQGGGLHPKSEMPDPASSSPRRLVIEWTAQL